MPPLFEASSSPPSPPPPSSPPPSCRRRVFDTTWGRDREGGNHDGSAIPPPLTPPHKGEGNHVASTHDPTDTIWRDGAFHRDGWAKAGADAPLADEPLILSKKRWLTERDRLTARNGPLGLLIEPGETVGDIADDLPRLALIALSFPKFSDGRAFSTARLLREKHGFAGELRAIGNVLADQIPLMRRVGFDSFEVTNEPTRRALAEGRLAEVTLHYQPAGASEAPAGTRPWLRRSGG